VVARFATAERERPLPSIERALSGPGSRGDTSWRRQVKIVTGGQGPGQRDQETLDRARARLPLAGPRRITILGCTRGAGQTVTALMTGHLLAAVRAVPVAALDLNPGSTSLAARHAPAGAISSLLAAGNPEAWFAQAQNAEKQDATTNGQDADKRDGASSPTIFDVIADPAGATQLRPLEKGDYQRLADLLTAHYPLTMIDPAPTGLTRVLAVTDQLVLVAPASPDAATSLANTQQWLSAHGYEELTSRAVTVINGVSRRTMDDVLRAESAARGRCRAIVRVPWDDLLSARPGTPSALQPQTRIAYTALAGVLVAGMAMAAVPVPGRNPGEHSD
jgi:MinD-like ATPase involved in chromosome partitioning or flagellar assembly